MPSASRVSAACFMVAQSDWLPMMMAMGLAAISPPDAAKKKARIIGTSPAVARRPGWFILAIGVSGDGMAKQEPRTAKPAGRPRPTTAGRRAAEAEPAVVRVPARRADPAVLAAEVERLQAELAATRAQVRELEAKVDIDPLLGIFNRRGFERELSRSLAYVKRYGTRAALLYADLDGFKAVNDRFGHAA